MKKKITLTVVAAFTIFALLFAMSKPAAFFFLSVAVGVGISIWVEGKFKDDEQTDGPPPNT